MLVQLFILRINKLLLQYLFQVRSTKIMQNLLFINLKLRKNIYITCCFVTKLSIIICLHN